MQLVQEVLEMHKPNCTIDQIDPAEVLTLRPSNIKSGPLRVVASLSCS